ncbi:Zona occludens toxin [Burkholderia pseudomallei]|uniref:zonular occludens toxin domain-containing protein n=1 Tax=Burkholderia pseudomallei TaxID=28450 RepID=UPI000706D8A6|nr:zonular occludens toxin domain-containing protein [Burkholderia pseudomallei]ALJ71102.1 Zona occludens toxin [Burkholderia pseudomallei]
MAINVYCGVMGSGKSYEVVSGPILHAISSGRRVVTNVDGISGERIQEYLVRKRGIRVDSLGAVVHVTNDRIKQPSFFPDLESPDAEFVVRPGDLVAIDEAWRFWGTDSGKIQDEHMQFFRMHRHMVDPITGLSCDVALMTQDISGLHRALRAVIEMSFRMHKLKSLGIRNGYRVEMYEGWKHNAKTRTGTFVKRYDAEIFPLYQSYAGSSGTEAMIDKRQNVLANVKLLVFLGVLFALSISGVVYAWRFFFWASFGRHICGPCSGRIGFISCRASRAPSDHSGCVWRMAGRGADFRERRTLGRGRRWARPAARGISGSVCWIGYCDGWRC